MFLNISLKSKGKLQTIIFIITVFILVFSVVIMVNIINKTKNGVLNKNKLDLTFLNYYTNYDMTVISNKNINTYNVKEWHKEGIVTKLEYLDYMKNKVTITLQKGTCNISNSGNIAKLVINNMHDNRNISSLSTFGYLYNIMQDCCCSKTQYDKNGEIKVTITIKDGCLCGCNKISKELGIYELELILIEGKPKNYTIYDKNKKEYISIVYNVFEKNTEI